ncbi:MAG: zinc-finger domain-containing protein [Sulfuricella sp.]|jgi:uncharacterized Zn-finger protein|nr:zinc-finger domain-containing protein [Sulfuricella sp.]
MQDNLADNTRRYIEVTAEDLPLHCPTPAMSLWNSHPRVYLPLEEKGEALCPYCGTLYKLKGGPARKHH